MFYRFYHIAYCYKILLFLQKLKDYPQTFLFLLPPNVDQWKGLLKFVKAFSVSSTMVKSREATSAVAFLPTLLD